MSPHYTQYTLPQKLNSDCSCFFCKQSQGHQGELLLFVQVNDTVVRELSASVKVANDKRANQKDQEAEAGWQRCTHRVSISKKYAVLAQNERTFCNMEPLKEGKDDETLY